VSKSDPTASDIMRLREASEWVQRLSESNEDAQALTDQWMHWCKSNALNLPAFEQMQRVWNALPDVRVTTNPELEPMNRPKHRIGVIALAASIVLAVSVTTWFILGYSDAQELATPVGKQRSIILTDGTQIDLAPDSLVSTRFTLTSRDVQLKHGQAFFAITHSRVRPFIVHVGSLTVTAIGTAFDVRIGPSSTVVTVSEGRVGVSPSADASGDGPSPQGATIRAGVGERVTFSKSAHQLTVARIDPKVAESWREGTLQFVGESLEEVAAVVNRYAAARIVVAPALQQTRFTGTVLPNNVDEWLKALEQIYAVTVVDQGVDGVLIRPRADHAAQK
jgi:transmembrane sensor